MDDYACHNGEAQLLTDQVRALEPGTPAYAYAKGLLCSYCPVGVVSPFRAQQFMAGNGLACYELDAAYDVAAAREALEVDPSIARAALSPGGRGFHVVIPVAPEPTSVSELQWALKQVHDHLVYRYGPLFGKIDRGLTSGIELHYVASHLTRIFRETALPLMTGAPPARYTEDRRRFVPGFGDGASGGAGRLGPFEDTTDADSLAWRDRTRQRIRSALEYLDLPDGSRNDVWIPVGFCLVGAELEGRALYEVTIGARQIFIDWSLRAFWSNPRGRGQPLRGRLQMGRPGLRELPNVDLTGADLSWADLTGANLTGANLTGANLSWTSLMDADMPGTGLRGANFNRTNLTRADLTGANVVGLNLNAAYVDDRTKLDGAIGLEL